MHADAAGETVVSRRTARGARRDAVLRRVGSGMLAGVCVTRIASQPGLVGYCYLPQMQEPVIGARKPLLLRSDDGTAGLA